MRYDALKVGTLVAWCGQEYRLTGKRDDGWEAVTTGRGGAKEGVRGLFRPWLMEDADFKVVSMPDREADATLIASAPDMLVLLRELEWSAKHGTMRMYCPICDGIRNEGHNSKPGEPKLPDGCPLGTLLTKLGRE